MEILFFALFLVHLLIIVIYQRIYLDTIRYYREKTYRKSFDKREKSFSSGPVVVVEWKFDKNWTVKYISSNCETVLGYTKDEMLSEDFNYSSIIHKDDLERVSKEVSFYTKDKTLMNSLIEFVLKWKYRWFYDFNHVIKNSSGEIESIRGYMFDQTQLKESEIILQKMNEDLKLQKPILHKKQMSQKISFWQIWVMKWEPYECNYRFKWTFGGYKNWWKTVWFYKKNKYFF